MKNKYSSVPALSVLLAGIGVSGQALAQANDESTAYTSGFALEEIVVTARKREEGLQNTPISITALSSDGLEKRQIVSIDQVSNVTPNLTINTSSAFSGSSQTPAIFLRGIGQTDFTLNTDPGVGIYVDGVYISRSVGGLLDLVDVRSVEILRGPQGTLFGRNTIGGAINIVSNQPSDELSGKAKVTLGSDDLTLLSASLSVPFSDTLKGSIAIQDKSQDGHVTRVSDGLDLGDKDNTSFRGALYWAPNEKWSFQAIADYTESEENGTPLSLIEVNQDAPFVAIHNIFVAPTLAPTLGGAAFFTDQFVSDDLFTTQGAQDVFSDLEVGGLSLTTEYQNNKFSFKSITAYRDLDSSFSRDGDASPLNVNATSDDFSYDQFSQEFQFQGTALEDRLKWILGLYYFEESGVNVNFVDFGFVRFQSGGEVDNESTAVFAQGTYDVNDKFSITAGLRYTDESRSFNPITFVTNVRTPIPSPPFPPFLVFNEGQLLVPNGGPNSGSLESTTDEVTPLVNLAYQPSSDLLTYFTYSQGFKSGGFTQRVFPALSAVPSFDPETVDVYEVGVKYSNPNGTFRINGSAYFTDYSDLQVTVQVGVAPTTQNAAEAEIKGVELELQAIPARNLLFEAGIGYTDAEYTELDGTVAGITLDSQLPGTSEWTINSSLSYTFEINNGGTITPRLDWTYRSEFFFDANNTVEEDGYDLINASITYQRGDNWKFSLFGKNLGDEIYLTHGESILNPAGFALTAPARTREWGVSAAYEF